MPVLATTLLADPLSALTSKLSGWLDGLVAMIPNLLVAVIVVVGFGFAARYVQRLVARLMLQVSQNEAISNLLGSVARVATVTAGAFIALGLLQLDKTVTSLLAGVGVIGLALGFAFQDIASNFMSGILMAFRRPFDAGDLVEVDGEFGHVEKVELRATLLKTIDGISVIVPNKSVFQNKIKNFTRTAERRVEIVVGVAYSDDLRVAREVTERTLESLELRDDSREVDVVFLEFGDSSINLAGRFWVKDPGQNSWMTARSDAIIALKEAFDAKGLSIPFPIRTLDFGAAAVGGERVDAMKLRVVDSQ